ncbi:MAG: hypothetical protein ABJB03_01740 [Rhodoglobus sp.]
MKKMTKTAIASALAVGLAIASAAPAAFADSYAYPGAVNCNSPYTAVTSSTTHGGTTIEHRVTGYGGNYYYTTPAGSGFQFRSHDWGYYSVWDARVAVYGGSTGVDSASIACA